MTQQINLYLPEFRRKKDPLTFENMVLGAVALVFILMVITAMEFWDGYRLDAELEQRRQELSRIVAETEQLLQDFGTQSEDSALARRVDDLEAELDGKRILQRFLTGRDIGSTEGFSEYLADLARYHLGGLRLTAVRLMRGGEQVELEGEVLSPHLVPQYFQSLRQGETFAGKEFETIRITDVAVEEGERPLKRFSVATAN